MREIAEELTYDEGDFLAAVDLIGFYSEFIQATGLTEQFNRFKQNKFGLSLNTKLIQHRDGSV